LLSFSSASTHHYIYTFPYTTLFRSRNAPHARYHRGIRENAQTVRQTHWHFSGRAAPVRRHVPRNGERPFRGLLRGLGSRAPRSGDRKSTRLNSSHGSISYAVFCLKK